MCVKMSADPAFKDVDAQEVKEKQQQQHAYFCSF